MALEHVRSTKIITNGVTILGIRPLPNDYPHPI